MTDLELTKRCAEAISYKIDSVVGECCYHYNANGSAYKYDPLHDDAQAMALVKKFRLHSIPDHDREGWWDVFAQSAEKASVYGTDQDLNRAICECVAKLKQGESG